MSNTTIAQSRTVPDPTTSRTERGLELYREHADEFLYKRGAWLIPSETGIGAYEVRLGPVETCECKDFEFHGHNEPCKHSVAARIAHAKSRVCSCCGSRVLGRFVTEVAEEDQLLSWFAGDVLCATCVSEGFWT